MYKLISSDLDGTLLDDISQINKDNIPSIKRALAKGVKVVLCSGRSPDMIKQFETELGLVNDDNFCIGFNGSMVYNCKTRIPIYKTFLKKDVAIDIINNLKKFDVSISAHTEKKFFIYNMLPETKKLLENTNDIDFDIIDDFSVIKDDIYLLTAISYNPKILADLKNHMLKINNNRFHSCYTAENCYEFMNVGSNKSVGLKFLADYLKIDMKDVLSIGDNYNDIEMLQKSGMGIAVANAPNDIKLHADYVTKSTNTEGALREAIDKYIN